MSPKGRAVIAGGAGFVGSHLCHRLIAEGYHVTCLDNYVTGKLENLADLIDSGRLDVRLTDVADPFDVAGDVDLILHFASPASPADYLQLPLETMRAGSVGTFNMLELAREKQARFIFASTSESYGDRGRRVWVLTRSPGVR